MKVVDIVIALLFILGAVVQINDPDPYVWIALYFLVGLVAGLAVFGKYNLPLTGVTLLACLIAAIWTAPGFFNYITQHSSENLMQDMSADRPYIEQTREFLGMVIAVAVMGFYLIRTRKAATGSATTEG